MSIYTQAAKIFLSQSPTIPGFHKISQNKVNYYINNNINQPYLKFLHKFKKRLEIKI